MPDDSPKSDDPIDLLVSFCSGPRERFRFALALFRDDGERLVHRGCLDLAPYAAVLGERPGVTGLCRHDGAVCVGVQGAPPALLVLPAEGEPRLHRLKTVSQIHSMASHEGRLLVVSTGDNAVVEVDAATGAEREAYRLHPAPVDILHLNGIAVLDGEPVVSLMGETPVAGARNGEVRNLETGEALFSGLRSPHSVLAEGGDLYVLESETGVLFRRPPGGRMLPYLAFAGYVRGLQATADRIFVGRSSFRPISQSRGFDRGYPQGLDEGERPEELRSCVYVRGPGARRAAVETTLHGAEIYDLFRLRAGDAGVWRHPMVPGPIFELDRALARGDRAAAAQAAAMAGDPAEAELMAAEAAGDWKRAAALAKDACRTAPEDVGRRCRLVRLLERSGDPVRALFNAEKALDIGGGDGLLQAEVARLAALRGAHARAAEALRAALPTAFNPVSARLALARALLAADDAEGAKATARGILAFDGRPPSRLGVARLLREAGDGDGARRELAAVLEEAPWLAAAQALRAETAGEDGDAAGALEAARRAFAAEPLNEAYRVLLADRLAADGRGAEARDLLQAAPRWANRRLFKRSKRLRTAIAEAGSAPPAVGPEPPAT